MKDINKTEEFENSSELPIHVPAAAKSSKRIQLKKLINKLSYEDSVKALDPNHPMNLETIVSMGTQDTRKEIPYRNEMEVNQAADKVLKRESVHVQKKGAQGIVQKSDAPTPTPMPSYPPPEFFDDVKKYCWEPYGNNFVDAMYILKRTYPIDYKYLTNMIDQNKITLGVVQEITKSTNAVGFAMEPLSSDKPVPIQIETGQRSSVNLADTIRHELTHAKMIIELKIIRSQIYQTNPETNTTTRTNLGRFYSVITEALAYRKGLELTKANGQTPSQEMIDKVNFYETAVKYIKRILNGDLVTQTELAAADCDDLYKRYKQLTSGEIKRLKEFMNYYYSRSSP